jgi:hypothetical protein
VILENLELFVSFSEIEKLLEAAIESEEVEKKKKDLASEYIRPILMNIKTILSTLNKNFNKEKCLKKIKSKQKRRSLEKQLIRFQKQESDHPHLERLKVINPYLKLLPYFFFKCKHFEKY